MKQNFLIKRLTVSYFLEYGLFTNEQKSPPTVTILLRIHREYRQNATFDLQDSSDPLKDQPLLRFQRRSCRRHHRGRSADRILRRAAWGPVSSWSHHGVLGSSW